MIHLMNQKSIYAESVFNIDHSCNSRFLQGQLTSGIIQCCMVLKPKHPKVFEGNQSSGHKL